MSTQEASATTIADLFATEPAVSAPTSTEPVAPQPIASQPEPQPFQPAAEPQATPEAPQAEPPKEEQHRVPLAELLETRRRAQEAERQNQQLLETLQRLTQPQQPQTQPTPIDPIADPEGAYTALQRQMQDALLNQRLDFSEDKARAAYGSEVVDKALEAAERAGFKHSFVNKRDPYAELVKWHQGQTLVGEIGADPAAYRERIKAEILAELRAGVRPATTATPPNLPPSLASATKANGTPEIVQNEKDFFKDMMSNRRTQ